MENFKSDQSTPRKHRPPILQESQVVGRPLFDERFCPAQDDYVMPVLDEPCASQRECFMVPHLRCYDTRANCSPGAPHSPLKVEKAHEPVHSLLPGRFQNPNHSIERKQSLKAEPKPKPKYFLWTEPNVFEPHEEIQFFYNQIRNDEIEYYPCGDYMQQQARLNNQLRMELINWLFELEGVLKTQVLTVHVAVNIIDRYLGKRQMVPTGMKLLGIGALRIACNQVEQRSLDAELIIQNTTKYKIKTWNIEEMEDLILSLLGDKLRPPTTLCFLQVYGRACGIASHPQIFSFAQFLADLAILVHQNSMFLPSTIAMCCLRFSLRRFIKLNS